MKHTFKTPAGPQITVEPSPTRAFVWLRWHNPDPNSTASTCIVPIPVHMAGVVAQAIEATATAIEEMELPLELPAHALQPAGAAA